ncbi:hypothetical protein AB1Y20_019407 [Prymnesium parvum]|uniref:Uncharacterized protein n=1 Tax=Prymnesium parvum TaxID=97485 RepID=A0AB34JVT3_PRYPA
MGPRLNVLLIAFAVHVGHGFDVDRPIPSRPTAGVESRTTTRAATDKSMQPAGIRGEVSKWYARYQGFVSGAAKVSRFISMGCGVWLVVTTPFALIGSAFGLRPSEIMLCGYLCIFGVLMFAIEVPLGALQRLIKQYFLFIFTRGGRAAFIVLAATIASSIKHVGMVTKAVLIFNAGLNFYILNSQDRRFESTDAQAKQDLDAVGAELRNSASDALSMGKYLGFGKLFGSSSGVAAPTSNGFDSAFDGLGTGSDSFKSSENTWPGSGDA